MFFVPISTAGTPSHRRGGQMILLGVSAVRGRNCAQFNWAAGTRMRGRGPRSRPRYP